jgi:hypothetical protein
LIFEISFGTPQKGFSAVSVCSAPVGFWQTALTYLSRQKSMRAPPFSKIENPKDSPAEIILNRPASLTGA